LGKEKIEKATECAKGSSEVIAAKGKVEKETRKHRCASEKCTVVQKLQR
jgi:hypothetical protein